MSDEALTYGGVMVKVMMGLESENGVTKAIEDTQKRG